MRLKLGVELVFASLFLFEKGMSVHAGSMRCECGPGPPGHEKKRTYCLIALKENYPAAFVTCSEIISC